MMKLESYYKQKVDEAESIEFKDLLSDKQKDAKQFMKILKSKDVLAVFDGIQGTFIELKVPTFQGEKHRLHKNDINKISAVKSFRWIECDGDVVTIGF